MTKARTGVASRRKRTKEEIFRSIKSSYSRTDGCPPLATHWGGYNLADTPWLQRLAEGIANDQTNADAWGRVEGCDSLSVVELLYLITMRGRTRVENDQNAARLLRVKIEKLLSKCDTLRNEIRSLMVAEQLAPCMPYAGSSVSAALRLLREAEERLAAVRTWSCRWGTDKRDARHWYVFLLATIAKEATGTFCAAELTTLINAARAAQGDTKGQLDEEAFKKRVRRWMAFLDGKVVDGRVMFRIGQSSPRTLSAESNPANDEDIPF